MTIKNIFVALGLISGCLFLKQVAAAPAQVPIFLLEGNESLTMINMSNDHELYFKAYDDYSDIDGDGVVDTTYNNNVEYYGYFDSGKCYGYDGSKFEPEGEMNTRYYCNDVDGDWSGNFLNWATMTRMDAIRKVLYGGYRSTDTSADTVLERAFLPKDAHAFVKYFNDNNQVNKLTPFAGTDISICNLTQAFAGNSKDNTDPPLMRVAGGDFSMWTAHARTQCQWSEESNESNDNNAAITGVNASSTPPSRAGDRLGGRDFIVRVEACVNGLEEGNCRIYPDGNRKPIGLLQEHGEDGSVKFGLMTGSYERNKSGGVLRKNVSDFRDEVEEDSDGTFSAAPADGGIVDTLNKFRLTRYDFNNGAAYVHLDSCAFAQFGFDDGQCSNWGNPQSEIYLETLRYFGGLDATAAFSAPDDDDYINNLGTAAWVDPIDSGNYCAPVNVIHFNASTSSFDGDQLGGFSALPGAPDADDETDLVGAGEGLENVDAFVGEVPGSTDKSCSPKALVKLSDARGVCPESPWLEGTYDIAGLAYYANRNSIRTDLTEADGVSTADIRVKTYGVALSPAQPVIEIPIPGDAAADPVILLPACMEFRNDAGVPGGRRHNGNCAIVDFRVVTPHTEAGNVGTGKFMVLWESAQAGGDYDQDMGGVIEYTIDSNAGTIEVETEVYTASTGGIHGFGYVISGTTQDGLHIHSGHNRFNNYTDPYGLRDCDDGPGGDCETGDGPSSIVFTLGDTTAVRLETPMFYATKWGGFAEEADDTKRPPGTGDPNDQPDEDYEWDADGNGLPDNYFFARNPGQLSGQLAAVFDTIATVTSSASVVANSVSLQTTTRIYQARFDSADWSGQILSFPLNTDTGGLEEPEWDAGEVIADQDYDTEREWITWDGSGGVPFRWDDEGTAGDPADDTTDLLAGQVTALSLNPETGINDGLWRERIDFIRGDRSNELANGGTFRNRSTPLGDVVHSTPLVVAAPSFRYPDTIPGTGASFETTPYSSFKTRYEEAECYQADSVTPIVAWSAGANGAAGSREPMVYFGSNDGALHAVSACTGHERLAYVPGSAYPNLGDLSSLDYSHKYFVDGASTVVDAFFSADSDWHTVLVGTMAAGGQGIFALDVTDPNDFDESNADDIVLWDITATPAIVGSNFEELGYTFSQPVVVKAEGHGWVAIFGNGYEGKSGTAMLYVVDIEDGTLLTSIDLGDVNFAANGGGAGGNGLSTVSAVDKDGDGDIDILYGGDLKGNIWRFSATPGLGFSLGTTSLLYSAKTSAGVSQSITSRISLGRHPYSAVGRMLYFGTGKYYELDDQDPDTATEYNTMYGIWDRDDGSTIASTSHDPDTDTLQQQTINLEAVSDFDNNTFNVRVLSDTPVTWVTRNNFGAWNACAEDASCGWYLDLVNLNSPVRGEKMVSNPILRSGRLIFITTIPSLVPCAAGGTSWLMEIDPATGGRLNFSVFDLNGDGVFDFNDDFIPDADSPNDTLEVSGKESPVGILQPPAILMDYQQPTPIERKYSSGSRDGQVDITGENPNLPRFGRQSWTRLK